MRNKYANYFEDESKSYPLENNGEKLKIKKVKIVGKIASKAMKLDQAVGGINTN